MNSQRIQQLLQFVRADIAARYAGNVLGQAWALLAPALQLALFWLVFAKIFKARVPGLSEQEYLTFLALGMWPWFAFSEAVSRGTFAIAEQASLLSKVYVSIRVLVLARVLTCFAVHGAGQVLVLGVLAAMGAEIHWTYAGVTLLAWLALLVAAFFIAHTLAILHVFARDVGQALPYLLGACMFLTPILYTRDMVPAAMKAWLPLNPVAYLIETARDTLLHGQFEAFALIGGAIALVVLGILSVFVHHRLHAHVEDFL